MGILEIFVNTDSRGWRVYWACLFLAGSRTSYAEVAKLAGLAVSTVRTAIRGLQECGFVRFERDGDGIRVFCLSKGLPEEE